MSRKTLSEHRSKVLLSEALHLPYHGWQLDLDAPLEPQLGELISTGDRLVIKVDEAIKGRFKKGLVALDVRADMAVVEATARKFQQKGHRWLLAEPMAAHEQDEERYLALARDRAGVVLSYTEHGGIDVEAHRDSLKHVVIDAATDWSELVADTGLSLTHLEQLVELFCTQHMVLLEANPYLAGDGPRFLDLAIEVDDAAAYFVDGWSRADIRRPQSKAVTPQEQAVKDLAEKSPASFALDVLNPDGSIFLLLSGGGASVVVADEVYNNGQGELLANYGEYSGNPNTEETYLYTRAVVELLLNSAAERKVLFIGGAVANFTDVANTFDGIVQALDERAEDLRQQEVKVFVRRGGPRQEIGLRRIEDALQRQRLLGAVHSPATPLTEAVKEALKEIL